MGRLTSAVFLGFALTCTAARAQTSVTDRIRKQAETQAILAVRGARMQARGQTIASRAAQKKVDAEAAKKRKYAKNHRAAIVARAHPAAPKTSAKDAAKSTAK